MLHTRTSSNTKIVAVRSAYAQSLAWLAVLAATIVGVWGIVELVFIDVIHGNPDRTQGNAIITIITFTPVLGIIALAGTLLVFTLPQCFQAAVSGVFVRRFGSRAQAGVLLALPITAVITWYCYDYLTPSDFGLAIGDGPDWKPYQHGLTVTRYVATLAFQAPVTLFSVVYAAAGTARLSRRTVILLALAAAVAFGGIMGHREAEGQYQFL